MTLFDTEGTESLEGVEVREVSFFCEIPLRVCS